MAGILRKGALVVGHVVDSKKLSHDSAPYAGQQPSILSIHFDKILMKNMEIPLNASVRALASTIDANDAGNPLTFSTKLIHYARWCKSVATSSLHLVRSF